MFSNFTRKYFLQKYVGIRPSLAYSNRVMMFQGWHNTFSFTQRKPPIIFIPIQDLQKTFSRSSGPGGQNVNKLNTKVELRFNVHDAYWLEDDIKKRIINDGRYVNSKGEMIVTSERHRTQEQNQSDAYQKLQARVQEFALPPKVRRRFKYKETKEEEKKRVNYKRKRSEIKRLRGNQTSSKYGDDW